MKCPNCYSEIPSNVIKCPRCDWQLKSSSAKPRSDGIWGDTEFRNDATSQPAAPPAKQWTAPVRERETTWDKEPRSFDQNQWNAPAPTAGSSVNEWGDPTPPAPQWNQPMQPVAPPDERQWDNAKAMIGGGVPSTVPLTGGQKAQLLAIGVLPFGVMLCVGFFFLSNLGSMRGDMPFFVPLIFAGVGLFVLYLAVQSLRDFFAGVALVQIARLEKVTRVRQKNGYSYYAHFERIGRMSSNKGFYNSARQGALYEVTYSPHTKRLWNAVLR